MIGKLKLDNPKKFNYSFIKKIKVSKLNSLKIKNCYQIKWQGRPQLLLKTK